MNENKRYLKYTNKKKLFKNMYIFDVFDHFDHFDNI